MALRANPQPVTLPGPGEPPLPPFPGSVVDTPTAALHVRRAGQPGAPVAVFVHGLGGASTNWTDLMALLSDAVDAHAPDLPGFGRSGPPRRGGYALDTHVAAVREYVESLGVGAVHLFGNSLGGAVAIRLAATRPDLVRTLTLSAPALPQYRVRKDSDPRLGLLLLPGFASLVNRGRERTPADVMARRFMEICVADPSRVSPERLELLAAELTRRAALPWANQAFTASLRGLVGSYLDPSPRNLWRQVAKVQAPTLAVFGRRDRLVPVALARRAGSVFPNARVVVLDDAAHVPQMEQPQAVADLARQHLREHGGLVARPAT